MSNWKAIVAFVVVAAFYEVIVLLLWFGLKWMLTPFISPKVRLVLGILFFIFANFSILAYMLRLGAPWVNYGNTWYFYFLNGVVIAVILLVAKLVLKLFNFNLSQGISLSIASLFLVGMATLGLYWAYSPIVKSQTIKVDKKIKKPIKIAMVSDLHLGTFFGNGQLEKLNKIIAEEKPDAIVIAGDIMDDDMVMYKKRNMGETLSKLSAPLGVYATMGNHDRAAQEIVREISKTGIRPLFDESVNLTDDVILVGRKDRSVSKNRLATEDLLKNVDTSKTTVLVDHQPDAIDHHSTLPIDVQLSGHTHRGQIWPINYITDRIYTLDHGYAKINNKHFFTSSGYGFWGPPFKTTAQSEVWMITIEGK